MPIPDRWFYKQRVLGKDGTTFNKYKIKTMHDGHDGEFLNLVSSNGRNEIGKIRNDPRIIPSRRWLRRYNLDEIPQIIKLFTGEMKLVGIRPNPEYIWDRYPKEYKEKTLRYKPGLISPNYAHDGIETFDDLLSSLETYFDEYEKNPMATDIRYFSRFLKKRIMGKNLSE